MAKVREIRALIALHYDSESAAAKELNWKRQRLNRITGGTKEPNIEEVKQLSIILKTPFEDVANIFLRHKSPNGRRIIDKTKGREGVA